MANWCVNYITFSGERENISELEKEFDQIIDRYDGYQGQLPEGFQQVGHAEATTSDYMFDHEKCDVDDKTLTVLYKTKWDISADVIQYICTKYALECKGTCIEEQNRSDTCGFIVVVRDSNNETVVIKKVLSECGLDVDYMVEDSSYFSEEFLESSAMNLANTVASLYKAAVEDANYQNQHEAWS